MKGMGSCTSTSDTRSSSSFDVCMHTRHRLDTDMHPKQSAELHSLHYLQPSSSSTRNIMRVRRNCPLRVRLMQP